ncbi:GNAT family N-acetyltransferase [Streptomyces sp. NPDC001404]|uniref:GNAT family N-acetyltransferase n=1 Tax=Streptomyces sp. NPDC001404 TaxID=3364571 RepID=UPI0036A83FDB
MTSRPQHPAPTLFNRPYNHPCARTLLEDLHAEQLALYGFADRYTDTPAAEFAPPHGTFVVAFLDSRAIACGGCRRYDSHTAEIKRMYVVPHARGQGIGRIILGRLEQHAIDTGATVMLLETGRDNDSALALYTAAGYTPIPPYTPGRNPVINRALHKQLASPGDSTSHPAPATPR